MFLFMLGASLTFGAALLAAVIFTDGALVALRTAAQVIGWLFVLATLAGLVGLRRASLGQICAASVTLCSGLAVLYMSYFFEWNERPPAAIRHAAAETFSVLPVAYKVFDPVMRLADPVMRPADVVMRPAEVVREAAKAPAPRRTLVAAALPASPPQAGACSALTGVESLQCDRCSEMGILARVICEESVRLEYCESEAGDETTCPSPIPHSYPR